MYCHPAYLTSLQYTSYNMPGWKNYKLESRMPGDRLFIYHRIHPLTCKNHHHCLVLDPCIIWEKSQEDVDRRGRLCTFEGRRPLGNLCAFVSISAMNLKLSFKRKIAFPLPPKKGKLGTSLVVQWLVRQFHCWDLASIPDRRKILHATGYGQK